MISLFTTLQKGYFNYKTRLLILSLLHLLPNMETERFVDSSCSLKKKFNSFKLKGILSLLSITYMAIVIGMTTISSLPSHKTEKETNITTVNMNNTLCDFIQSFSISGNVYVSICLYQETFRIDLRFFINKKASIKGLHLTTEQWKRLIKIISIINNVLSRLSYKQ